MESTPTCPIANINNGIKGHSDDVINHCVFYRCVELIICEQMNKYKARLKDINTLEFAENKAKSRLTFIRRSMVRDPDNPEITQIYKVYSDTDKN